MTENKQPCTCMQNMRDLLIAGKVKPISLRELNVLAVGRFSGLTGKPSTALIARTK